MIGLEPEVAAAFAGLTAEEFAQHRALFEELLAGYIAAGPQPWWSAPADVFDAEMGRALDAGHTGGEELVALAAMWVTWLRARQGFHRAGRN